MTPRLGNLMSLALLPFFAFFRSDSPHQLAAIKELEDALPEELLAEDAAWFEAWKASGIAQKAVVPYFHQLDFDYKGYRRCLDASAAMVALLYGKVKTAEEVAEYSFAFLQLYREEGFYLERTVHYMQRVGLEYIKKIVLEDETRRKALAQRLMFSLSFEGDGWKKAIAEQSLKKEYETIQLAQIEPA